MTWEIYLSKVSWIFLINSKVMSTAVTLFVGFVFFFLSGSKIKIKAEMMSPCQHLLWSAQVHDFECTDGYGMWQLLVASEWLCALGKHSFLLKAIRRERGKRGGVLQTPFTYLGDELIFFCANGNWEDPWKKINPISLFWKVKKALLASGNGLRGGGSCIANVLQHLSGL